MRLRRACARERACRSASVTLIARSGFLQVRQRSLAVLRHTERLHGGIHRVAERNEESAVRLAAEVDGLAGVEVPLASACDDEGDVVAGVAVALAKLVHPDDDAVVEQCRFAFGDFLHLAE